MHVLGIFTRHTRNVQVTRKLVKFNIEIFCAWKVNNFISNCFLGVSSNTCNTCKRQSSGQHFFVVK